MPSLFDSIEANIQSHVATFLLMKEQLLRARNHANPAISSAASALYNNQLRLEEELRKNLTLVEQVKSGNYAYSDLIVLGVFANDLNTHNKNSQKVIDQSRGLPTIETYTNLAKWVFGGAAAVLMFVYLWRGTQSRSGTGKK